MKHYKKFVVIPVLIFVIQILYLFFYQDYNVISSPLQLVILFMNELRDASFLSHIINSIQRVIVGFIIALTISLLIGLITIRFSNAHELISPIIELIRPIPPIAWIPLSILTFGIGNNSSYFIVFIASFFPLITSIFFGLNTFPAIYKNVSMSFEIGWINYLSRIQLPYLLPHIMNGAKIGLGMAWMSVIASELIGAQNGLGYYIQINRLSLNLDKVIIGMIAIGLIGLSLSWIIQRLEKNLIKWKI